MGPELRVDGVGHLLGERAVGLAREAAVEVAPGESLERAHPLPGPERGDIQDGQRDEGARERPRVELNADGNYIYAPKKFVAAVGVRDLIVVETEDAIFVCPRARAQDVKLIVQRLQAEGSSGLL